MVIVMVVTNVQISDNSFVIILTQIQLFLSPLITSSDPENDNEDNHTLPSNKGARPPAGDPPPPTGSILTPPLKLHLPTYTYSTRSFTHIHSPNPHPPPFCSTWHLQWTTIIESTTTTTTTDSCNVPRNVVLHRPTHCSPSL